MKNFTEITLTIIVCVIATVFAKSCVGNAFAQSSQVEQQQLSQNTQNGQSMTKYALAGINVSLPSKPVAKTIQLPPEAKDIIKSYKIYEVEKDNGKLLVLISHIVYTAQTVNLDGGANGAISEIKKLPYVDGFSSTKESVKIAGLDGIKVSMVYRLRTTKAENYTLIFARGNESWHVSVSGVSDEDKIKNMRDAIFTSIELTLPK